MTLYAGFDPSQKGILERMYQAEIQIRRALEMAENASNNSGNSGNTADLVPLRTLTGTATSATHLSTFTGSTISDNITLKAALQELETALEVIKARVGYYKGKASTFAALPTSGVSNGDWAILTADDGSNKKGIYERAGGAWVSVLPTTDVTLDFATNAEALAGTSATKVMNPVRTKEAIEAKLPVGKGINRANTTENVAPTAAEFSSPKAGSLAITKLTNGILEVWQYESAWTKAFKYTPTVVDGNLVNLTRANATENVAPTSGEVSSPVNGDTAIVYLNNGKVEFWSHNGTAWAKAFVVDTASVPDASETVKGKLEIANTAENNTGTDNTRAVTPKGMKDYTDTKVHHGTYDVANTSAVSILPVAGYAVAQYRHTNNTNVTYTVNADTITTERADEASKLRVLNEGTGVVTLAAGSGVTLVGSSKVLAGEAAIVVYDKAGTKAWVYKSNRGARHDFAPSNEVTVAATGKPTAAEIKTWNDNKGADKLLDTVIKYNGTTASTNEPTYVFHVNGDGEVILLEKPPKGEILETVISTGAITAQPHDLGAIRQIRYTGSANTTATIHRDVFSSSPSNSTSEVYLVNDSSGTAEITVSGNTTSGQEVTYVGPTKIKKGDVIWITYSADGTKAWGSGSSQEDRKFVPNSITVALAGKPTTDEIKTYNDGLGANKALNTILYYTGTTSSTDAPKYVFHSDKSGNITLLEKEAQPLKHFSWYNGADVSVPNTDTPWTITGGTFHINDGYTIGDANTTIQFPETGKYEIIASVGSTNNSGENGNLWRYIQVSTDGGSNWTGVSSITFGVLEIDGVGSRSGGGTSNNVIISVTNANTKMRVLGGGSHGSTDSDRNLTIKKLADNTEIKQSQAEISTGDGNGLRWVITDINGYKRLEIYGAVTHNTSGGAITVTLPKSFANTSYQTLMADNGDYSSSQDIEIPFYWRNKTVNSFQIKADASTSPTGGGTTIDIYLTGQSA